jgi:hypothetical protein
LTASIATPSADAAASSGFESSSSFFCPSGKHQHQHHLNINTNTKQQQQQQQQQQTNNNNNNNNNNTRNSVNVPTNINGAIKPHGKYWAPAGCCFNVYAIRRDAKLPWMPRCRG